MNRRPRRGGEKVKKAVSAGISSPGRRPLVAAAGMAYSRDCSAPQPRRCAMTVRLPLLVAALVTLPLTLTAQPPDDATRKKIEDDIHTLRARRNEPTLSKVPDEAWVEVEVY